MVPETPPLYDIFRLFFRIYTVCMQPYRIWLQELGLLAWTEQMGTVSLNWTEDISEPRGSGDLQREAGQPPGTGNTLQRYQWIACWVQTVHFKDWQGQGLMISLWLCKHTCIHVHSFPCAHVSVDVPGCTWSVWWLARRGGWLCRLCAHRAVGAIAELLVL